MRERLERRTRERDAEERRDDVRAEPDEQAEADRSATVRARVRRRVEAALRESEQRFATLAEGSPVLLWVNGPAGNEFVNRAYREFVGVDSDEEISGYGWSRFVHPADRDEKVGRQDQRRPGPAGDLDQDLDGAQAARLLST